MLLAIAVGSTTTRLGVFQGERLVLQTSMGTDTRALADEYAVKIRSALLLYGCDPARIDGAILASVMPPLVSVMRQAVGRLTAARLLVVGPGLKSGLQIQINDPGQLGSDLVCCAVGALARYEPPLLVCSMGTATTMIAIDSRGAVQGGAILPGVKVALDALTQHTAQLPQIDLEQPPKDVIGRNTIDCMKSGVLYGNACTLDGMAARMEETLGQPARRVATGSYAAAITPYCWVGWTVEQDLVLEGLQRIHARNAR